MRKVLKAQFGFLVYGFVFWLPIAIFVYVLFFLFNNVEDLGKRLFLLLFPEAGGVYQPGFGVVLGVLVVYFSGVILKATNIRKRLARLPLLGLFFGGGEVITVERLAHLTPCLFQMSPTCLSYGWILSEEKVSISDTDAPFSLLNVYYPNVPTLITGQVFPVRKDTVIKLGNPSKEIINVLIYSFRSPESIQYLPWEGESAEDFERRAREFGIQIRPGPTRDALNGVAGR